MLPTAGGIASEWPCGLYVMLRGSHSLPPYISGSSSLSALASVASSDYWTRVPLARCPPGSSPAGSSMCHGQFTSLWQRMLQPPRAPSVLKPPSGQATPLPAGQPCKVSKPRCRACPTALPPSRSSPPPTRQPPLNLEKVLLRLVPA